MVLKLLSLFSYGLVLIFGAVLSFDFAGIDRSRENRLLLLALIAVLLAAQALSLQAFGLEATRQLYPLLAHLPIALFLIALLHVTPLRAGVSVLCAYLCCQIPRWAAEIAGFLFGGETAYYIGHILALPLVLWLLERYVVKPAAGIMTLSRRSLLLFGGVPLLYYIYDYVAAVYTDLLARGAQVAVQFIPCVVSCFFFLFALAYYGEICRRSDAQRESELFALQAQQAKRELEGYRKSADSAALYRHDMRHHLALIGSYLASGEPDKALAYVRSAQSDIEHIAPKRLCLNETADLILSAFAQRAESCGVAFTVQAQLPERIALPETELCTLLANALENAVAAAANAPDEAHRAVKLRCSIQKQVLLLETENGYAGDIALRDGFPVSGEEGHGFGVRSIAAVAERHGGFASFSAEGGAFLLKAAVPLEKEPAAG